MIKKIILASLSVVFGLSAGVDAQGKIFFDEIVIINKSTKDILVKGKTLAPGEVAVIKTDETGVLPIDLRYGVSVRYTFPYETYEKAVLPITPEHNSFTLMVNDELLAQLQKYAAAEIIKAQRKFEKESREEYEFKKDKRIREISAEIAELGKIDAPEAEDEIIELVKEKYALIKQTYEDMLKKARRDINTLIASSGLAMGDLEKDLLS